MPRALITGATGFVGSHLADHLLDEGWKVRCTVRATSSLEWLEGKSIERVECDLRKGDGLDKACKGVDTIFHVAGVIVAPTYDDYLAGNLGGSRNLIQAAVGEKVRRFVHVSSLAAQGPALDGPVDESMTPEPISMYGRSKWEGEREVRSHEGDIEVVVVRPPVVYGTRDNGMIQVYKALQSGVAISIGGPKFISIVHVRDLCTGILAAAEKASPGALFYISNRAPISMEQLSDLVLQSMDRRVWARIRVPESVVHFAGGIADMLKIPGPFGRDKALEMTQKAWVCTADKAERELGWTSRIGLNEGMRETIDWYKQRGSLS